MALSCPDRPKDVPAVPRSTRPTTYFADHFGDAGAGRYNYPVWLAVDDLGNRDLLA
jgi:hypothetical protein